MATPVIMPRQGQSVESCIIAQWYKHKGDTVNVGDVLFSYETDKAAFDEEAKVAGILLEIFFNEGDDVPVLTNVCVIGAEGESAAAFDPSKTTGTSANKTSNDSANPSWQIADEIDANHAGAPGTPPLAVNDLAEIKISPRALKLATKAGLDHRCANPTGPGGRIMEKDIIALYETGPKYTPAAKDSYLNSTVVISGTGLGGRITTNDLANDNGTFETVQLTPSITAGEYKEEKLSNMRKVIARAMQNSLAATAQLTLHSSFDASNVLAFRKQIKATAARESPEANITLNDIILFAVSRVILNHRDLNAHFLEDRIRYFKNVHLGIAVDSERGLMVPTLFNANLKSLTEISMEVKKLADECRKGAINPDYLKNAGFTITNLGTLGIESFTPVLNPPQTGILGVNCITQRVKEVDGSYVYYPAMGLSLTFDHRALDGAPAARFLQELWNYLENFNKMLTK